MDLINDRLDHYGAGVTFYAYQPDTNQRVYLLGSERWGKDVGTYSDFGGGRFESIIESAIDTAAREAAEETCEIFGDVHDLRMCLWGLDEQYRKHGVLYPVIVKPSYDRRRCYVCFFIEVQYEQIELLNEQLYRNHRKRMNTTTTGQRNRDFHEKTRLEWFSDTQLLKLQKAKPNEQVRIRPAYATHVHRFAKLPFNGGGGENSKNESHALSLCARIDQELLKK